MKIYIWIVRKNKCRPFPKCPEGGISRILSMKPDQIATVLLVAACAVEPERMAPRRGLILRAVLIALILVGALSVMADRLSAESGSDPAPENSESVDHSPRTGDAEIQRNLPLSLAAGGGFRVGGTRFEGQLLVAQGPFAKVRYGLTQDWFLQAQYARAALRGSFRDEDDYAFLWSDPARVTEVRDRLTLTDWTAGIGVITHQGEWFTLGVSMDGGVRQYRGERTEKEVDTRRGIVVDYDKYPIRGNTWCVAVKFQGDIAIAPWLDFVGSVYLDAAMMDGYRGTQRAAVSLGLEVGLAAKF
jgi:hypothetical protein